MVESRSVTRMTIEDAEHISEAKRAEIIASYPAHEVEARAKGIPVLGSGRVFPVTEESISVEPFAIPQHWAIIGGLDFGWDHPTAGVLLAHDRDSDVVYVGACYRRSKATPIEHAVTLSKWGDYPWAWPHDGLHQMKDGGLSFRDQYADAGMNMLPSHATHASGGYGVEAGISEMLTRMQSNRLKVFSHLSEWWEEFRLYHRQDGKIVKLRDDVLDATRTALMMLRNAQTTAELEFENEDWRDHGHGRSNTTGY